MKKKSTNLGTTIVELLLYMGLLSIFIVMITNLFGQILNNSTNSITESYLQTNGNFLLIKLAKDINLADEIVTPSNIGESSTSMILKTGTNNISYDLINGRLVLTDLTGSYNLNDADTTISDFVVKRMGNFGGKNGLQISYRLISATSDNKLKSTDFNTFISLR